MRPIARHSLALLSLTILLAAARPLVAQRVQPPDRTGQVRIVRAQENAGPAAQEPLAARDVREEFRRILQQYPPAVGKVLKADPTLMGNAAYLAPFPNVVAFLQQHPEVVRDPGYFLDFVNAGGSYDDNMDPDARRRTQAIRFWEDILTGLLILTIGTGVVLTFIWIVRYGIEHRRWLRATKMQSDMQAKLLERMTSNDDLLAYMQSPAGRNLLQAMPVSIEPAPARGVAAPINRILWSVQAGFVIAAGGAGLLVIRRSLDVEFTQPLFVFGTLGLSLGVGFGLAAVASYLLSQKLGLFEQGPEKMRAQGDV